MGVVYHAHYLVYFELGRTEFMRARGISYASIEERGIRLAVIDARIHYRRPALYDQEISVVTTVSAMGGASVVFDYELREGTGSTLATGSTRLGCLDTRHRPTRLPADIVEALGRSNDSQPSELAP